MPGPIRHALALLALPVLCLVGGCSSDGAVAGGLTGTGGTGGTGGAPGTGGTTNGGTSGSSVSFDGTKYTLSITARSVTPGDEQHVCVVLEVPNASPIWITDIHGTLSPGSHHLIVDRQPGSAVQTDPAPCFPTTASDATRLFVVQQADTRLTLPPGVGIPLVAREHVFLQLHYANVGTEVRDITGAVELTLATGSTAPIEAKSLFDGTYSISIPPQSPGTATYFYAPVPATGARHVFALTSHTHHLGVRATIERVANAGAPATTPLHESLSWSEPPLTVFSPTQDFTGSDGLRLTCYYQNTTNQTVGFGTGVNDEMCFMWMYYYDQ